MSNLTIGIALAKNVFQVHGVDGEGRVVLRRKLRRCDAAPFFAGLPKDGSLVALEACA